MTNKNELVCKLLIKIPTGSPSNVSYIHLLSNWTRWLFQLKRLIYY